MLTGWVRERMPALMGGELTFRAAGIYARTAGGLVQGGSTTPAAEPSVSIEVVELTPETLFRPNVRAGPRLQCLRQSELPVQSGTLGS